MEKKSKSPYIAAFLLFALGIGYMVWSGISENSVYFLNVSEALASSGQELRSARLFGTVDAADLSRPENGLGVDFRLVDAEKPGQSIMVRFKGVVPDTFAPGAEVIVEGGMNGNAFQAKTLMTKCPSKYEKANREKNA